MHYGSRNLSAPMAVAALFLGLAALPGCKARTDTAQVKSGFKAGGYGNGPSDSLYQVLPNQSIAICNQGVSGQTAQYVKEAVPYWLSPIGREKDIRIVDGCQGDWLITLTPTTATYYAQTYGRSGTNTTRMEIGSAFVPRFTDRHEMGHVFGFCDLYNPSSCSNNTNDPHPSIMGSGNLNGGQMSQGDVDGIASIIQTQELAASTQAWATFLAAKTPPVTVALDPSAVVAGLYSLNSQNTMLFFVKAAADKVEVQDAVDTTLWHIANLRYQASADYAKIVGIAVGPKLSALTTLQVRITTGNTIATGSIPVAPLNNAAGSAGLVDGGSSDPVLVGTDPVNALDAGSPVLAVDSSDSCTCIRAQEAGCGLAQRGMWLSMDFVDQGLAPCTVDVCQNKYADIIASQCGGAVKLDAKFR